MMDLEFPSDPFAPDTDGQRLLLDAIDHEHREVHAVESAFSHALIIFTKSRMGPGRRDVKRRFLIMGDPPLRDHRRESGSFRRRQPRSVS